MARTGHLLVEGDFWGGSPNAPRASCRHSKTAWASPGVPCRGAAVDGLLGAVRAAGDATNHYGLPTNQVPGYGAAGIVISHAVKSRIHYVQHDSVNCFWNALKSSI